MNVHAEPHTIEDGASDVWQRSQPRGGIFKKNGAPPVLKEQLRSWISVR